MLIYTDILPYITTSYSSGRSDGLPDYFHWTDDTCLLETRDGHIDHHLVSVRSGTTGTHHSTYHYGENRGVFDVRPCHVFRQLLVVLLVVSRIGFLVREELS